MNTIEPPHYSQLVDSLIVHQSVEATTQKKLREEVDTLVGLLLNCLRAEHASVRSLVEKTMSYRTWQLRSEELPLRKRLNESVRRLAYLRLLRMQGGVCYVPGTLPAEYESLISIQNEEAKFRRKLRGIIEKLSTPGLIDPNANRIAARREFGVLVDEITDSIAIDKICVEAGSRNKLAESVKKVRKLRYEEHEVRIRLERIYSKLSSLIHDDLNRTIRSSLSLYGQSHDEDVFSEVRFKVLARLRLNASGFREQVRLFGYAKTVAKNDAYHEAERSERVALVSPDWLPNRSAANKKGEAVSEYFEGIDETHRDMFIANAIDGKSIREICEEYEGMNPYRARQIIASVRNRLENRLKSERRSFE